MKAIFSREKISRIQNKILVNTLKKGVDPYILNLVASRLLERVEDIKRDFSSCLEYGSWSDGLGTSLLNKGKVSHITKLGYERDSLLMRDKNPFADKISYINIDLNSSDCLPLEKESYDLIISNLYLHYSNDLVGELIQLSNALRPDGVLLVTLWSYDNLFQLKSSLLRAEHEVLGGNEQRFIPLAGVKEYGDLLLRAGFKLPMADQDNIDIAYKDLKHLFKDIKDMGQGCHFVERMRRRLSKEVLNRCEQIYKENFKIEERLLASWNFVYLTGWKYSENQPKSLERGDFNVMFDKILQDNLDK